MTERIQQKNFFLPTVLLTALALSSVGAQPLEHHGMCDASAAVAIGNNMFLVANDEDNILRSYRADKSDSPIHTFDLNHFLKPKKHREADIEAAARVGDVVYWISSHGTSKKGKSRPSRRRFFATTVKLSDGELETAPLGVPYKDLVKRLAQSPELEKLKLGEAAKLPPKSEGGLNIEGLAATTRGALLIGFRNPTPDGKALIVPLENPEETVAGKEAELGSPILLPLGGLGIRAIEYIADNDNYLIIAGHKSNQREFRIYR